jgi:hypothetical protein
MSPSAGVSTQGRGAGACLDSQSDVLHNVALRLRVKTTSTVAMFGLAAGLVAGCVTRPTMVLTQKQQALVGQRLHWAMFINPPDSLSSHHEHCAFCSAVIAENPANERVQRDGYTTDDSSVWICNACFDTLNPRFRWVTL